MKIEPLTPIESQNPLYMKAADNELYNKILSVHNGKTLAEIKEDGYRIHVHKKDDTIKAFTRQKKEVFLPLFPELTSSLESLPNCILDCELAGGIGHQGFKAVKKRFRSRFNSSKLQDYLASGLVEQFPLQLRVFDTLYWDSASTINLSLSQRREFTKNVQEKAITPSVARSITSPQELENHFHSLTKKYHEGLVCKNPSSLYKPGTRTTDWIKLKRAETFDLVALGATYRNDRIHQLLVGSYNHTTNQFEALAKVNAQREGLDHDLELRLSHQQAPLNSINYGDLQKHPIDAYLTPDTVVEVAAMNIQRSSNGYACDLQEDKSFSLRIGYLKSVRDDKSPAQATTSQQVAQLYAAQEGLQ